MGWEQHVATSTLSRFVQCLLAGFFLMLNAGVALADITVETGNGTSNPINNAIHQQICVDTHSEAGITGKRCFSFGKRPGLSGFQLLEFSWTWLKWSSWVTGAILEGEVYEASPIAGATIADRHTTTAAQDKKWLDYMVGTRLGLIDGYSVFRHNCRLFSQWEFRDAPLHW
jgi:hypothetical protein